MCSRPRGRNGSLLRVLRLLRLLEQRGRWTLDQLAVRFDVTTRTVRRDLEALEAAGYAIGHEERGESPLGALDRWRGTWWIA
jgi:DeoR/GlpR family transcriptional regulator of sugar metabolism